MGLFDFFQKGEEKPAQPKPQPAAAKPVQQPVAQPAQPAQPAAPQKEIYTVQSGDSLSKIAKHVYGDASAWHRIHQANTDQIKDPNLIHPGQKLVIPR